MDFTMDNDVLELVASVAAFFERRDDARAIAAAAAHGVATDRERWTALCEIGLPAFRVAEPAGIGAGLLEATALAEAYGAVLLPEPATASMVLARVCDESALCDDLLNGSRAAALCAFDRVQFLADGSVSGRFTAPDDRIADLLAVPALGGSGGAASIVLLDKQQLRRGDHRDVDPTRPMAWWHAEQTEPVDVVGLGGEDAIGDLARETAVLTLSELVGGMQSVLSQTVEFTIERTQFGRPIGSFQVVKHQLADMYVAVEQARAATQFAAITTDRRSSSAAHDVGAAVRWVPDAAIELFEKAIHLHGAMGYCWEVDIHLHLRRTLAVRDIVSRMAVAPSARDLALT